LDRQACENEVINDGQRERVMAQRYINGLDGERVDIGGCERVNTLVTEWTQCEARIAENEGKVYERQRPVIRNSEDTVVDTGECVDRGTTARIEQDQSECQAVVNVDGGVVRPKVERFAILNGQRVEVSDGCVFDASLERQVKRTTRGCEVRDDLANGVSIQQVRFFYQTTSGEREYVTECRDSQDSSERYEHFVAQGLCEDEINQEKGSVLVMGAPAYRRAGSVRQAADCRPLEDQSVDMKTEVCEDRYAHDRSTGTSFLRTRSYYKPGGEKKIVTPCGRDPNRSYDHTENASACDDAFDDTSKIRRVKAQT